MRAAQAPEDVLLYAIPPPLEGYHVCAAAEKYVHAYTKTQGISVAREKVTKNKINEVVTVMFACSRSGRPKNTRNLHENERVRTMRGSMGMGCPMRIKIAAENKL
jgi:hypothetical protein